MVKACYIAVVNIVHRLGSFVLLIPGIENLMRQILFLRISVTLFSCADNQPNDLAKAQNQLPPNPYKINNRMDTISTDNFWNLIDNAVKGSGNDNELKEQFLTRELAKLSPEEIKDFEIAFRKCVIDADDYKIMAAQKIIVDYVSDDTYLYFRCWLIGQGKFVYSETLKNPDYLAGVVHKGEECDFESLLYVATNAYAQKTGKEEDESFPRDIAIAKGLDYDFGAPPTKGEDWTEDELPTLLPKLWEKFN